MTLKICVLGRHHDDWDKVAEEVLDLLGSPEATVTDDDDALYGADLVNGEEITGGLCIIIEDGDSSMGEKAFEEMNYFDDGRGVYRWLLE